MKYSPKGAPPTSLAEWVELNKELDPAYKNLTKAVRQAAWDALLAEQEYVCAYCGRSLNHDRSDSHIDHFRPQTTYPHLVVAYENLAASCGPPGRNGLPSTCGDAKGNKFDEGAHIAPWDPDCETRFTYGGSGLVEPTAGDVAAQTMIEDLNLKDPSLTEERRKIIAHLEAAIADQELLPAGVPAEIQRWRTATEGRRLTFSQVAARYLEVEFALG